MTNRRFSLVTIKHNCVCLSEIITMENSPVNDVGGFGMTMSRHDMAWHVMPLERVKNKHSSIHFRNFRLVANIGTGAATWRENEIISYCNGKILEYIVLDIDELTEETRKEGKQQKTDVGQVRSFTDREENYDEQIKIVKAVQRNISKYYDQKELHDFRFRIKYLPKIASETNMNNKWTDYRVCMWWIYVMLYCYHEVLNIFDSWWNEYIQNVIRWTWRQFRYEKKSALNNFTRSVKLWQV